MFDVITIGSALVDIFVRSDQFSLRQGHDGVLLCQSYGDKIDVDEFVLRTGGGGGNTAVGFARMGFATAAVCEMGKDVWSQMVIDEFHQERVSANFVVCERHEQTGGSVILIGGDGGRTVLVHRGAASQLDPHDIPQKHLQHARWVHLSSISGRKQTLQTIFEAAGEPGHSGHSGQLGQSLSSFDQKISWNPGKGELQLLAEGAFNPSQLPVAILFVNEQEWHALESLQQQLLAAIPQIVVTNGSKGGRVWHQKEWHEYHSEPTTSVDDTGAGDAFATGYVAAHLRGHNFEQAIEWGKRNAQSVITQVGAKPGLLRRKNVV